MRIRRTCIAALVVMMAGYAGSSETQSAAAAGRVVLPLDADWRFHKGEVAGAQDSAFDDSAWQRVDVPHDWSIEGPFDRDNPARGDGAFLPTGVGWYRKTFSLPADKQTSRVIVEFDGVMANSEVWINGVSLGKRPNGYVTFRYDLTPHIHFGEDEKNVLAVRADTSAQIASRWYTGSGIYRHVRLLVLDATHIDPDGVAITTPTVTRESANVELAVAVRHHGTGRKAIRIRTRIVDAAGAEVWSGETGGEIEPDRDVWTNEILAEGAATLRQTATIAKPTLWDIDSPQLYSAVTSVVDGERVLDEVFTPFGIREAVFKPDTGFWLNGRNLKIKGVCLHHDGGAFGAAVPLDVWRFRLERLRELGVNAIRTAHNSPAPDFLNLCDQMGFLVMDEFFDCWTVAKRPHDYHKFFGEWADRDLRDTILRDRNHPSVILWSVGNEIHDTPREEMAKRILSAFVGMCHDADPTRPVTQALFRPNQSHDYTNGLADMLDVIGTNYRDTELLAAWRAKPTRKIIGTEQGHDRAIWLACRDNPQHSGQFLWSGIDYLGEAGRWPQTTFNGGLLDRAGVVQPRGLERQSWWSEKPTVRVLRRIAPTDQTPTDPGYEAIEWRRRQVLFPDWTPRAAETRETDVEVYSNCEQVELQLNGKSLGTKPLPRDARPRNWRVAYEPGTLVAIGRSAGQEVARDTLRATGKARAIVLKSSRERLAPLWDNVAVIEVQVVDENGVLVPTAGDQIKFSVQGPGQVIAVDNGSIVSHEPFSASERQAFQGRAVAYVRGIANRGTIEVTATAEGLTPGMVRIAATAD